MAHLGDSFGTINSLLSAATAVFAFLAFRAQNQEIIAQRANFQAQLERSRKDTQDQIKAAAQLAFEQKKQEREHLLSDKLERLLVALHNLADFTLTYIGPTAGALNREWSTTYVSGRVLRMAECNVLISIYFPSLKNDMDGLYRAGSTLTDLTVEVVRKPDRDEILAAQDAARYLTKMCGELMVKIHSQIDHLTNLHAAGTDGENAATT